MTHASEPSDREKIESAETVAAASDRERIESAETIAVAGGVGGTRASAVSPGVRTRARATILPPGTHVGRYVLAERLGVGGMGVVYRAHDPKLDRDVAVKLVVTTLDVAAAQVRLEREAQAMAKLSHPNVAMIHDIGTWNGQLFIAMELCTNGSLAAWLAVPHPWRAVVSRFVAAGRGLAAAHRIGLVHRDFKPDNVLVAGELVKVTDFGLVRAVEDAGDTAIEGTPVYMAPEQLEGRDVDARADQFAFGISLWEGITGERPFVVTESAEGSSNVIDAMLAAIRDRRWRPATAIPPRIARIVKRALEPIPGDRWPTLDAMLDALEHAMVSRRPRWIVGGLGVLAAGAAIAFITTRPPPVDRGLDVKLFEPLAAVYEVAGDRTVDPDLAAQAYHEAERLSRDTHYRLRAAKAYELADRCEAISEYDVYWATTGQRPTELSKRDPGVAWNDQRLAMLRIRCAREPEQMLVDREQLESLAEQDFRQGDVDAAVTALRKAIVAAKGEAPELYVRIGDILVWAGHCAEAKQAYADYLERMPQIPAADAAAIRKRPDSCTPQP